MHKNNITKGFTLIEIIVVIIIVGIIIAGSSNLLSHGFKSFIATRDILDDNQKNIAALEMMTRDLHAIRSSAAISSATTSSINFTDINGNSINYSLSGTTFTRTDQGAANVLSDNLGNLSLKYYDNTGANTSNLTAIRYIIIDLGSSKPTITINLWNVK